MLLQNELAILEFIHNIVETYDRFFDSVVRSIVNNSIDWLIKLVYIFLFQCELDVSLKWSGEEGGGKGRWGGG